MPALKKESCQQLLGKKRIMACIPKGNKEWYHLKIGGLTHSCVLHIN